MFILKSVFLLIIFSNHIFAKDFDDLFNINIEIEDEIIDRSIERSFDVLIFRLIGYEDYEKAKIINHDLHDITPKKNNWDLKRDCQPQLDQDF